MIAIKGLKKKYGKFQALNSLDLEVKKGNIFGLVGPNGAGKTTAIKIITGLVAADEGSVNICDIDALSKPHLSKALIGYVPDYFGVYDNLKVKEYLEFFASGFSLYGLKARKIYMELLYQVGLENREDYMLDSLSKGMQQRLALARALLHNPDVLIMDEPTNGLDPRTRFEFKEFIRELSAQGKTILISSHLLSEISEICTNIGIIEHGKMVMTGNISEIMDFVEKSNPLRISVLDGISSALTIFRKNLCVKTISLDGNTFMINFDGNKADEAILLQQLIASDIPVTCFVREPGNLESFFMQITEHSKEKIILKNDY